MAATRFDVLGIGNAIVDVIARTQDDFLIAHRMRKGAMALIDEGGAARLYEAMGPALEISGGSAANTTVGVASLGALVAAEIISHLGARPETSLADLARENGFNV